MAGTEGTSKAVPKPVSLFIVRLSTTMKSQRLYPMGSDIPRRNAVDALEALRDAMATEPFIEFGVTREGLAFDGAIVFPRSQSFISFAREFYKRNLAAIRFHEGVTPDEINRFLSLIITPAEQVAAEGGVETGLAELGVANISVSEVATRIVDTMVPEVPLDYRGSSEQPDEVQVDEGDEGIAEILAEAGADRARDRRMLMRALRDPKAVAEYLKSQREHEADDLAGLALRFGQLIRKASAESPGERRAAIEAVAEAAREIQTEQRGVLYMQQLTGQARHDRELADLVRELGADEVLDRMVEALAHDADLLPSFSQALKDLRHLGITTSPDEVMHLAISKMQAAGMSDAYISGVSQATSTVRMTDIDGFRTERGEPSPALVALMGSPELASGIEDEAIERLRQEAMLGTSDGDVIESLVAVAVAESRDEPFAVTMNMIEESVGFLIEAGQADVAADVAEAMAGGIADPKQPESHRVRMRTMLKTIARPESLAAVTSVLRRYRSDSPEYLACKRLMSVLGDSVVEPLLQVLAQEDDMAARKALIELISLSAKDYIPTLGAAVTDTRWYVVRNVVSILGRTRSPEALPHLQRALRHGDPRVRRETIRALASIRSAVSDEMLIAALEDDNAQNVELAARTLGTMSVGSAVPALEAVARAQGRGSREDGARMEAIRALAAVGTPPALAVLRDLAKQRSLFAGGRDRAIRQAAEEALRSPGTTSREVSA